ncbi:MAG: ankyrin repeat domain-containing protein, partial [Rhodospirillaceae bacterium]|nr:ankyrin repeat domain-containing protein [Rhodospirillaceae bacterium]
LAEVLPEHQINGKTVKADTYVFNRLAVVMRKVDSVLLAEILPTLKGYDLVARRSEPDASVFDGMMLRLPCRLAASHRALLEDVGKTMGAMIGVLTDCPTPKGREADFALLERIAREPASALMIPAEGGSASPRDLRTKLMTVAAKGSFAEISKAVADGADPQRADARGRTALHYLLGNAAVTGADRGKAIGMLY